MVFNVQVLRCVAATMVIWVHTQALVSSETMPQALRGFGYGGVDLFFVISGFIMVHTTRRGIIGPFAFWRRRLLRIVPLYYFFTAITVLVAVFLPNLMQSTQVSVAQVSSSLLFLPLEKTPGRIYPVYYLGWTLNYEIFFYAIFGILMLAGYKTRVIVATVVLAFLALTGHWIDTPASYGVAAFFYTRPIVLDFALGVLVAHCLAGSRNMSRRVCWLLLALGILWMVFGGFFLSFGQGGVAPPTDTVLRFGLPAALIVAGAVGLEQSGVQIGTRFARIAGDGSYSVYLSHYFFVGAVIAATSRYSFGVGAQYVAALATCIGAVILGIVVYRLVERPLVGDFSAYRTAAGFVTQRIG